MKLEIDKENFMNLIQDGVIKLYQFPDHVEIELGYRTWGVHRHLIMSDIMNMDTTMLEEGSKWAEEEECHWLRLDLTSQTTQGIIFDAAEKELIE